MKSFAVLDGRRRPRLPTLALLFFTLAVFTVPTFAAEKPTITTRDDLPRHTYEVSGKVADLVTSEEAFAPLAAQVRADIESDLEGYAIEDKTTLQSLHGTLLQLDLLDERHEDARKRIALLRDLEDKPAEKLMIGLASEARIAATEELGAGADVDVLKKAYRRHFAEKVNTLPWDLCQDQLQGYKGHLEMLSEALVLGVVQEQIEPVVAKTGNISNSTASQIVAFHYVVNRGITVKDETIAVLQDMIDRHKTEKEDIWHARSVDLTGAENLHPVTVAIWDTGVDAAVFDGRVFTNPDEKLDGKDSDGNGHVDDLHGVAYDRNALPTTGTLYPMGEATRTTAQLQTDFKGLFDMRAAIDSPEATALRQKMSELDKNEVKSFIEDLGHYACYSHGTHVAGIAIEGNPAAQVLVCRMTPDLRMIPEAPTVENTRQAAAAMQDAVDYYKTHGVRVVNMSWVIQRSSLEHDLELNGIGKDADERKAMAGEMFDMVKEGLHAALESAPDILFVGGAGNSDNDITFDEFIPPMFEMPNLLIAGAVDQAGEVTGFTSFGPTVNIYSNGFEVESYVPGGDRMKLSGTSMASPNVANLAAKLISLDDSLTPARVVELILAGADELKEGDQLLRIMNPKRSVELLHQEQAKASME
jgi:subtilisin family serine protease